MALATWRRGAQLPTLPQLPTFSASPTANAALVAQMAHLELAEVQTRISQGQRPDVAWLASAPVF